jgi:5-methylcytosine-specific restriction endonuclease McrA
MAHYRKIDTRIWNDAKFQLIWSEKWDKPSRVPKQNKYPYEPLPERESLCLQRRRRFKKIKASLLENAIERLGNKCIHCGICGELFPDHVIPISWGGTNDPINIQPSCKTCNIKRGNSLPIVEE